MLFRSEYYNAVEDPMFYNLKYGGDGGVAYGENNPFYGKHHTEETKKKISDNRKGTKLSISTRRKISESNRGKVRSDECKNKLRLSGLERKHTEETKMKISENHSDMLGENNPMYNKNHSISTRRKISESNRGKVRSEEFKRKVSENNKGKVWINNGIRNKFITSYDLQFYLDNGWKKGRFSKNKDEN